MAKYLSSIVGCVSIEVVNASYVNKKYVHSGTAQTAWDDNLRVRTIRWQPFNDALGYTIRTLVFFTFNEKLRFALVNQLSVRTRNRNRNQINGRTHTYLQATG